MTAAPVFEIITDSMICARCDGRMVITYDALRRPRKRCPKCDGTAAPRPAHPDQVKVPVTLASLTAAALPSIEPGQLRCQRCARSVEGTARFHPECAAARAAERRQKPCPDCGHPFIPTHEAYARCVSCRAQRKAPKTRLCAGCNRITPRTRGPKVVARCADCVPISREPATRLCLGCGRTRRRNGGLPTTRSCAACRTPLVRTYAPKPCRSEGCDAVFQPTGPNARFCEAHR